LGLAAFLSLFSVGQAKSIKAGEYEIIYTIKIVSRNY